MLYYYSYMWELQRARNTDRRCAVAIPCSAAANSDGKKAQYYPRQVRARCARRVMKEQQTWHNKLAIIPPYRFSQFAKCFE
jgi:hypothetical protein